MTISTQTVTRDDSGEPMIQLSTDESFHFELLLPLAEAVYSGSDIAPLLGAAKHIKPGDFDSFSQVLHKLALDTKAQALDPENRYDPVNVRDTLFSAATYFRRADYYLHGNWDNPLINSLWEEQLAAFNAANAALPIPGQRLQIPADGFTVEAIWYTPSLEAVKRPTLILGNGYDGSQEDLYHTVVVPALERGWNAITYEGPGQPKVRREQNIGFIHDWERVVTPVIDTLYEQKLEFVDTDRLVLFGFSMGGYLAARAAAFDDRIKALLVDGGVFDLHESYASKLTPELMELFNSGDKEAFDRAGIALLSNPHAPSTLRWGMEQGLWSFKIKSPFDFLTATKKYALHDVVDRIKVPTWIADAEHEAVFVGQPQKLKAALGDLATIHPFVGASGYHCQVGAFQELSRVMFAWLHKTLW